MGLKVARSGAAHGTGLQEEEGASPPSLRLDPEEAGSLLDALQTFRSQDE